MGGSEKSNSMSIFQFKAINERTLMTLLIKTASPGIDVISENDQMVLTSFVFDKMKRLLDITHDDTSSHRV